jgi:hypothetical protein
MIYRSINTDRISGILLEVKIVIGTVILLVVMLVVVVVVVVVRALLMAVVLAVVAVILLLVEEGIVGAGVTSAAMNKNL